jgi:hypothetical protein
MARARMIVPPRRLFLWAMALMPVMALPALYLFFGFDTPISGASMFAVWVIDSFAMIIHETGHMLTSWLFGQPAGMIFYPEAGGAVTYLGQFQPWLLALLYFEFALTAIWLHVKKRNRAFRLFSIFVFVHIVFMATPLHLALGRYMGHGAEMLAGAALAWGSLFWGDRWKSEGASIADAARRIAGVTAGIYLVWENMVQMTPLMLAIPQTIVVSPYNGKRVVSDIELAANVLGIGMPASAMVVFVFGILCVGWVGYYALRRPAA